MMFNRQTKILSVCVMCGLLIIIIEKERAFIVKNTRFTVAITMSPPLNWHEWIEQLPK